MKFKILITPHVINVSFLPFRRTLPIISIINIDIAATATGQKQAGACGCPDFYIYHKTGGGRRKGEEEHESEAKGCRAAGTCHGSNGTAVMGIGGWTEYPWNKLRSGKPVKSLH